MKSTKCTRILAVALALCLLLGCMSGAVFAAEDATTVYFLNTGEWANVNAYTYNTPTADALGGWPGTAAEAAPELGEGWVKVTVPAPAPFSIIFFNAEDDTQRAELYLPDAESVYVTADAVAHKSQADAEAAMGEWIYFLNTEKWAEVGAYIYGDKGELLGGWGATTAVAAEELGGDWLKVPVSELPPYSIIFFNKAADTERAELYLPDGESVYVTADAQSYKSQAEAEEAMGISQPDDGSTMVYFLNSEGWAAVNAYAYNTDPADALGGWPGTAAVAAEELGEGWMKVSVPSAPDFNVIFFNAEDDAQRVDVYFGAADTCYACLGGVFATQTEAEEIMGIEPDPSANTTVYFLNSAGWAEVGAYVYNSIPAEALGGWGTTSAVSAPEVGDDWMKVDVPADAPFNIIFYNKAAESERAELQIPNAENVYVAMNGNAYASAEAAENAMNATPTTIYFLNWNGTDTVFAAPNAYVWSTEGAGEAAGGWPGTALTVAPELGENWWQVQLPANASNTPFNVIINGDGTQLVDTYISNYTNNYITAANDSTVYTSQSEAEKSVGIVHETKVYYLNAEGWESIGAYVYGACGEALGSWPGTDASASGLGENWVEVTVPAKAPFSIIFFDKANPDPERAELYLSSDLQTYVAGCKTHSTPAAYGSSLEAELAMGIADPSLMTTLYFYNSRGWGDINGYVFREVGDSTVTVGAGWPGTACEPADEIGENWWKLSIPRTPTEEEPIYVVFNDGVEQTQEDILIDETVNVYVTAACGTYPTAAEAEEAAANDSYDDGCEDGPNADIVGYPVTYDSAGASLPYVTYEAEDAEYKGILLEKDTVYRNSIQSEASGREAVGLGDTGDYVEFTLTESANALVLRYAMADSADGSGMDASLSLYIDGEDYTDLALTSRYAWVYGGYPFNNNPANGMAHRFFDETRLLLDETLPAGTTIRLQKDSGDDNEYTIDFIECELVAEPAAQPENSLSITDFGAVANDGADDRAALEAAIAAAKEQGKEVWLPAGQFDLVEEEPILAAGVTIRGAGMWHTELYGAGAAFKYQGTSKFYDFAMTGVSTVRDDSGDLAGFEGTGSRATNITIQNIWMEHMKVGVWSANTYRMAIQGCRIRNTYADGINLCSATHDSVVRNNSLRNTGDDAIASWPWLADCSGNTISHNTIQVPTLANGVAIYGGGNQTVEYNHVMDTINNGAGIVVGSEFSTAKGYTGTVTVCDNLLERCGSMQSDENYPIGAIWIWSSWSPMTTEYVITRNVMIDCVKEGILIEVNSELTGLQIRDNAVDGATCAVYEYLNGPGSGIISGMSIGNLTDAEYVDDAPNFNLIQGGQDHDDVCAIKQYEDLDLVNGDWYHAPLDYMVSNGYINGTSETTMSPNQSLVRAQLVAILYRMAGSPSVEGLEEPFTDVDPEADFWYYDAVVWAYNNKVVNGTSETTFEGGKAVAREQIATILYRYYGEPAVEGDLSEYKDADKVNGYAVNAMIWATQNGLINGVGENMLNPLGNANRAQAATILYRYANLAE